MKNLFKRIFPEWGMDKWAHLGIGGLASALITIPFVIQEFDPSWRLALYPIAGLVPLLIFSVFKELVDSTGFDWRDILAAVIGWMLVELATVFGALLV